MIKQILKPLSEYNKKFWIAIGLLSAMLVFRFENPIFAQDWQKHSSENNWGDTIGHQYQQITRSAIGHGKEDIPMSVIFAWSKVQGEDNFVITSVQNRQVEKI